MIPLPALDLISLAVFAACWLGYTWFSVWHTTARPSLMSAMFVYRRQWMREMQRRDNRIVDTAAIANLLQPCTFFASTTIFILGGVVALLAAPDQFIGIVSDLPFAKREARLVFEIKIMLLLAIFGYGFFKFTWAMRQYSTCTVLVVSAPPKDTAPDAYEDHVERAALMASFAGENFNLGVRAYYYGLAALAWFVHPIAFVTASVLVTAVLYHREFLSRALGALTSASKVRNIE